MNDGAKKAQVRSIIGGVIGGILGLCLIILGVFIYLRRKKRSLTAIHQEIDGNETFGKPELKGYSKMPIEMGPEQKHELESKENHELTAEQRPLFELPGSDIDVAELETPVSRITQ